MYLYVAVESDTVGAVADLDIVGVCDCGGEVDWFWDTEGVFDNLEFGVLVSVGTSLMKILMF